MRSPRLDALRAELERRRGGRDADRAANERVCAELRAPSLQHPKQLASLRSLARMLWVLAGRRAGKTSSWNRDDLACAIERPGFRATYCNTTKAECVTLAWRSDTGDGWMDLLACYGRRDHSDPNLWHIGGTTARALESTLDITFGNGSKLECFAADTPGDADKFRGRAKSRVRVDEVQKWTDLQHFVDSIVGPGMMEKRGQMVLTGTPGEDCAGYWYELTKPEEDGERVVGWEGHEYDVLDNPFFGATVEERLERVRDEIEKKGKRLDDPDVQREFFRKWIKTGSRHVYAVQAAPKERLVYAPLRTSDAWKKYASLIRGGVHDEVHEALARGWYDHEASLRDLPRNPRRRTTWLTGIGVDFATDPDSFAVVVEAFTHDAADTWELWSWKRTDLVPDDWRVIVELLFLQLEGTCAAFVGDPAGMKGELRAWRERFGVPISDADKQGKEAWLASYNGDIRRGLRHYRAGSPLLDEQTHLLWMPTLPGQKRKAWKHRALADGRVPGNDCADASLYLHREVAAFMHRKPNPPEERAAREERQAEQAAEAMSTRRVAARAAGYHDEDDDGWEQVSAR